MQKAVRAGLSDYNNEIVNICYIDNVCLIYLFYHWTTKMALTDINHSTNIEFTPNRVVQEVFFDSLRSCNGALGAVTAEGIDTLTSAGKPCKFCHVMVVQFLSLFRGK